jgi:hypothetical protein
MDQLRIVVSFIVAILVLGVTPQGCAQLWAAGKINITVSGETEQPRDASPPSSPPSSRPAQPIAVKGPDVVQLSSGERVLCWSRDGALKLLKDVKKLRGLRVQLELLERQLALRAHRIELQELEIKTVERMATHWKEVADAQAKALAKREAWYESRWFWFAAGLVATTAVTAGSAYLYHQLTK